MSQKHHIFEKQFAFEHIKIPDHQWAEIEGCQDRYQIIGDFMRQCSKKIQERVFDGMMTKLLTEEPEPMPGSVMPPPPPLLYDPAGATSVSVIERAAMDKISKQNDDAREFAAHVVKGLDFKPEVPRQHYNHQDGSSTIIAVKAVIPEFTYCERAEPRPIGPYNPADEFRFGPLESPLEFSPCEPDLLPRGDMMADFIEASRIRTSHTLLNEAVTRTYHTAWVFHSMNARNSGLMPPPMYQGVPINYADELDQVPGRPKTPAEKLANLIKGRMEPAVTLPQRRQPLGHPKSQKEERARETLAMLIGAEKYQSYLRTSKVSVTAASGKIYVIHPDYHFTDVFQHGKQIERICVVMEGDCPPSDSVITRYLMIKTDEAHFRDLAIKQGNAMDRQYQVRQPDTRSLIQIYKSLKQAA